MTTRAAILARVSTTGQAEADRHSLPVQTEMMERLAERSGWEVVSRFEIPGESAFTHLFAKRPQFLAALEAAERREFEVLIVYDFSRFARNQLMAHASLQRLRDAGVRLFGSNGVDYTADDDMAGMEAIFAARASRDHSRRVAHAIERRHLLGLPTGDVPFGYQRGNPSEPPAVVPEEAVAIRWAYRRFIATGSYLDIAREFNTWGLRPHSKPRRIGTTGMVRPANVQFTTTGVQRILENPFYIGQVVHRGETRPGQQEAILDPALWAAVQERKRRGARSPRRGGLLSGIALCDVCERSMWSEQHGAHRYYGERTRGQSDECRNTGRWWRAEGVDDLIGSSVATLALAGDWLAHVERKARRRQPAMDHAKVRQDIEEQKRRVTHAYFTGGIDDAEYHRRIAALAASLSDLADPVAVLMFVGERVTAMATVWRIALPEERRTLARELLRSVRLDTGAQRLWLEPWPEYAPLFAERREFNGFSTPGWTRGSSAPSLYLPEDLGVAS